MKLLYPTKTPVITQKFGNKNELYKTAHDGIDFRVINDPERGIYAAADGVVIKADIGVKDFFMQAGKKWIKTRDYGKGNYYGNEITIQHEQNGIIFFTRYGHLKTVNVKVGDSVKAGQVLGVGGNTGYSQGAHLHFMLVESSGGAIDPFPFFKKEIVKTETELAREWVIEHKISNGENPGGYVTRSELWVMLYRLAKKIMEWLTKTK